MTFIHGGEEFGRTKAAAKDDKESTIHNTYKTTTGANDFKWDLKAGEWKKVNDAYAAYIKMRKEHPAFRMTTAEQIFANVNLDPASTDSVVIVNINGQAVKDSWDKIKVVMNSTKDAEPVANVEGWTKVADGYTVGDVVVQNSSAAPQAMSIWYTKADEANDATETQGTATDTGTNQKSYDSMFVRGNIISEGWDPEEMTYADGKWTSNVHNFVAGSQFKVLTNSSDWDTAGANGIFGVCGDDKSVLKANAHEDCGGDAGNVTPGKEGSFKLVIDDKTMAWELVSVVQ